MVAVVSRWEKRMLRQAFSNKSFRQRSSRGLVADPINSLTSMSVSLTGLAVKSAVGVVDDIPDCSRVNAENYQKEHNNFERA